MADGSNAPASKLAKPSFFERHYFLMRRLHSLTGIVPIGVFLIAHLVTNSSVLWGKFALRTEAEGKTLVEGGAYYFQKEVTWINEEVPHLALIEVTLWVSIAFHSILGVIYALTGRSNVGSYGYADNWRYSLQRISGYVGILFIFYHVAHSLAYHFQILFSEIKRRACCSNPGYDMRSHEISSVCDGCNRAHKLKRSNLKSILPDRSVIGISKQPIFPEKFLLPCLRRNDTSFFCRQIYPRSCSKSKEIRILIDAIDTQSRLIHISATYLIKILVG